MKGGAPKMTKMMTRSSSSESSSSNSHNSASDSSNNGVQQQAGGTPGHGNSVNGSTNRVRPILLQVLAMIGLGALLYSSAADWFATLNHNAEISGYTSSVIEADPQQISQAMQIAHEYNAHMPAGMLRDPYSNPSQNSAEDSAYAKYEQLMSLSSDSNSSSKGNSGSGVIGEVTYPSLGIGLPIYHGTNDSVLTKGVGHLYGSSLPVGGTSTHSILTSHSGLVHANLFTNLPKAEVGDTFTVQALGETHWYEVKSTETVLPQETERLAIVDGKDIVTLFTCTPIGINSHRFMVHGERIDPPADAGTQVIAGDGKTAGFPWWALIFVGGSSLTAYLIFAPTKRRADESTAVEASTRGASS